MRHVSFSLLKNIQLSNLSISLEVPHLILAPDPVCVRGQGYAVIALFSLLAPGPSHSRLLCGSELVCGRLNSMSELCQWKSSFLDGGKEKAWSGGFYCGLDIWMDIWYTMILHIFSLCIFTAHPQGARLWYWTNLTKTLTLWSEDSQGARSWMGKQKRVRLCFFFFFSHTTVCGI